MATYDEQAAAAAGSTEFDGLELGVRSYCRSYPQVFDRARGCHVYDRDGRRSIDMLCGAGALGYGHNNPRIKAAVLRYLQSDGIVSSLDLYTTAKLGFLRKFHDVVLEPRGLEYRVQCCGPTGTDAVEAALKLARKVTGRHSVVAFTNAYHGVSLGSLAATASEHERGAAGVPLEHVVRAPFDGFLGNGVDTVEMIEAMFGPGGGLPRPAAFILETIQAEGGLNVASPHWLRRIAGLAAELGALLMIDDIQVGCGRSGAFFSFERAGIEPDIICLSKAIGGMGMPMALVLVRPAIDLWAPGEHVGTFRGNNLAFVAAEAALDYWRTAELADRIEQHGHEMADAPGGDRASRPGGRAARARHDPGHRVPGAGASARGHQGVIRARLDAGVGGSAQERPQAAAAADADRAGRTRRGLGYSGGGRQDGLDAGAAGVQMPGDPPA